MDVADATVYTVPFNRLRGQLTVLPDEVRLSNAELRFFGPRYGKTRRRRNCHRLRSLPLRPMSR